MFQTFCPTSCTLLTSTRACSLTYTSTTSLSRAGCSPAMIELYSSTKRTLLCSSAMISVCEKVAEAGVSIHTCERIGCSISTPLGTYRKKPPLQKAACSAVYLLLSTGTHSVIKYFWTISGYSRTAVSRSVKITPCCLSASLSSVRTTVPLSWTISPDRSLISPSGKDCSMADGSVQL